MQEPDWIEAALFSAGGRELSYSGYQRQRIDRSEDTWTLNNGCLIYTSRPSSEGEPRRPAHTIGFHECAQSLDESVVACAWGLFMGFADRLDEQQLLIIVGPAMPPFTVNLGVTPQLTPVAIHLGYPADIQTALLWALTGRGDSEQISHVTLARLERAVHATLKNIGSKNADSRH